MEKIMIHYSYVPPMYLLWTSYGSLWFPMVP